MPSPISGGKLAVDVGPPLVVAEEMLRTPPPNILDVEAEQFVSLHYQRKVQASALGGERDRNFLVSSQDGWSGVLKFYNPKDDANSRTMQHEALTFIKHCAPSCPVPEIILTSNGDIEVATLLGGSETVGVLLSRLSGENPVVADLNIDLRQNVGEVAGTLSNALAQFRHPAEDRAILWDLMRLPTLAHLTGHIDAPERRISIERWLDRFTTKTYPIALTLPYQMIHNDLSLSNLMIDHQQRSRVVGVIDFGDMVVAPRINEFAIAASYFISPTYDPISQLAEFLQGVATKCYLESREIALLPELVKARLVTRILLAGWRAQIFPENQGYILRSMAAAWKLWDALKAEPPMAQAERLMTLTEGVFTRDR